MVQTKPRSQSVPDSTSMGLSDECPCVTVVSYFKSEENIVFYRLEARQQIASEINTWVLVRRYKEFAKFRSKLIRVCPPVKSLPFPRKTIRSSNLTEAKLESRRRLLHTFMQQAIHWLRVSTTPTHKSRVVLTEFLRAIVKMPMQHIQLCQGSDPWQQRLTATLRDHV